MQPPWEAMPMNHAFWFKKGGVDENMTYIGGGFKYAYIMFTLTLGMMTIK